MSRVYKIQTPSSLVNNDIPLEDNLSLVGGNISSTGTFAPGILFVCHDGTIKPLVTVSSGTGTFTKIWVPIGENIYYYGGKDTLTTGPVDALSEVYSSYYNVPLVINGGSASSFSADPTEMGFSTKVTVYLQVSVNTTTHCWEPAALCSSDGLVSGRYYIKLGYMTEKSNGDGHFMLEDNNPLFYYDGTNMIEYENIAGSGGGGGSVIEYAKYFIDPTVSVVFSSSNQTYTYFVALPSIPEGLYFVTGNVCILERLINVSILCNVALLLKAVDSGGTETISCIGGASQTLGDSTQISLQGKLNLERVISGTTYYIGMSVNIPYSDSTPYAEISSSVPNGGPYAKSINGGLNISLHRVSDAIPT